ncbi:MAG: hypothetical protein Tsb0015_14350 [Simkaniaceae bacterium]
MLQIDPSFYQRLENINQCLENYTGARLESRFCFRQAAPKDSLDLAGDSCRNGCGLASLLFIGALTSFFYGGWHAVKTIFYTLRACICGKEASLESVTDLAANLHNLADAVEENLGDPDRIFHGIDERDND